MEDINKMHYFIDRSSVLGLMKHSTFNPIRDNSNDKVARSLARYMMNLIYFFNCQHIKGDHNDVY